MKVLLTVLVLALAGLGAFAVSKLDRGALADAIQVDPRGMAPQQGAAPNLVPPHPAVQASWSMLAATRR